MRTTCTALFLAMLLLGAQSATAQQPSYYILRPSAKIEARREEKWKPAQTVIVSRAPYAYGYFGASPSTKWSRSTNYHRTYTTWQRR